MEETTPAVVETPTSETYINPDGTWKEGWKEALVPEDLRDEKFYDSDFCANLPALIKTAGNQAKMLGKKGVIPLSEKSTETEVMEWRKAHGVPDKYTYQKPTDLKMVELEDEWVNQTLEKFNKANLSQRQAEIAMEVLHERLKSYEDEYERSEKEEVTKINQQILMEENTEYETNSQLVNKAVRQFTQGWPDEDILKLFGTVDSQGGINSLEHIELKPLLRKFLTSIGKSMGEHRMVTGETGGKSLQEQLDEVRSSEAYQKGIGKARQDAVNKAIKLQEQINAQMGR